ncbi:MAG: hypothetical protein QME60_08820 [Verrucomicrobiota bacterium]|nr:hypothetical protein [Verrucomicrobiota bacterium]
MKQNFLGGSMAAVCSWVAVSLLAVPRSHAVEVKPKDGAVIQDAEVTKGDVYFNDGLPDLIIRKTFTNPKKPLFFFRPFRDNEKNLEKLEKAKKRYKGKKIPTFVDIHADIASAQGLDAPEEGPTKITARGNYSGARPQRART